MSERAKIHDYAAEQMNHLLTSLAFQIHRAAKLPGPDEIHDVRVAIRRFTQGLELFADFYPKRTVKKIERWLTRMIKLTNHIRDRDIGLEYLVKLRKNQLRRRLVRERLDYQREFGRTVARWTSRDFSAKWRVGLSLHKV